MGQISGSLPLGARWGFGLGALSATARVRGEAPLLPGNSGFVRSELVGGSGSVSCLAAFTGDLADLERVHRSESSRLRTPDLGRRGLESGLRNKDDFG